MFSKSLIQFSVEGQGCVPSLLFDLRPNYGGGNEDNDLLQKGPCRHCYTQCPQPCSRPPLTHASARDSWTLTGKSGSVSCGVTAPFSWVLVHTRLCLCPPRICFPKSCVSSGGSIVGLMLTSSQRAYAIPRSTAPKPMFLQQSTADPNHLGRHPNTVLSQSLWDLWSWFAQGLFEPSERLWRVWGLILNTILPLLPSC